MHTQFTEESKMATALTLQTDVTSGEAYKQFFYFFISLNLKLVLICQPFRWSSCILKNLGLLLHFFKNFIKSETSHSFQRSFCILSNLGLLL